MTEPQGPYSKGQVVPKEGEYVCVPCGFKRAYKNGEQFGECMSCLSGTNDGQHEEFLDGEEMWEPVEAVATPTE